MSPSATTTSTPTATPEPTTTAIVIGADAVRVVDTAGGEREFGYAGPIADVLGAMEAGLGPQTGTTEYPATNHTVASTAHEFGALTIFEEHYSESVVNDVLVSPVWRISTKAATIGQVHIASATGVAVGSSIDDVPGHADPNRLDTLTMNGATSAYILVEASSGSTLVPDGTTITVGVLAAASAWPGPITQMSAPSQLGGA
ncbi:hypothetical protein [Leifsonia aquatica]|uniref:hypothetical protein n=1 Tax=Leifsonia aquatica TaxID=144185 RepID=UPI0004680752|nr:hypothetical protein [Leifsonia aquatica]